MKSLTYLLLIYMILFCSVNVKCDATSSPIFILPYYQEKIIYPINPINPLIDVRYSFCSDGASMITLTSPDFYKTISDVKL